MRSSMLAAACGRRREADQHFLAAAELADRLRAPAWRSRVDVQRARMLIERNDPGDREEARWVAGQALERAERYEFHGIAAEARSVLAATSAMTER